MTEISWDTKLTTVLGRKTRQLTDHLGVTTVGQLVGRYPRAYLDVDEVTSVGELVEGELVTLVARVERASVHPYRDRRTGKTAYRTELEALLGGGRVWMTFFDRRSNAAYWRASSKMAPGQTVVVSGKFGRNPFKHQRWELTHPEVAAGDDDLVPLLPVYRTSGPLRSDKIRGAVRVVLDVLGDDVPDPLPARLRAEHRLLPLGRALRWMHRPEDRGQVGAAMKRLKFDEAFVAQVALAQARHEGRRAKAVPRRGRSAGVFDAFDSRLPFSLTAGQRAVEAELLDDLAGDRPMRRLLQGEVGSGKTILALRAMLRVVDSGGQAALLAPTEVLAQQHHRSITGLLGDLAEAERLGGAPEATRVALLTGSMGAAARRAALLDIASAGAGIVVGTHALLEDAVRFAELGLVVVDEQHRFGVEQRAALAAKSDGLPPHVLVMTATPIPRTVALTVFGDLDTSTLAELPAGRAPIQTTVVPVREQPAWLERVWERVREEVAAGRQCYVVCPRISADPDGNDSDGRRLGAFAGDDDPWDVEPRAGALAEEEAEQESRPLAAVEDVATELRRGALHGLALATLHGRLPPERKEEAMLAFAQGDVDVLVSTTVVEVGVDVGNATTMVVLDADRFGISQLHQLRGRVGRGGHPGLCLLLTAAEPGTAARARLDAVASTTDGFKLAELDLELRREGDVLGQRQSGNRKGFQLLSVVQDGAIIEAARGAAVDVVAADPELAGQPELRRAVAELYADERATYLDKT